MIFQITLFFLIFSLICKKFKADRSNLSQISKSASGGAATLDNPISITQNTSEDITSKGNVVSASENDKITSTLQTNTDNVEVKRSPRPRVISSNMSSKEERVSTSKWGASGCKLFLVHNKV